MFVINANYGDESLALLAFVQQTITIRPVTVLSVDTGWASAAWLEHVVQVENLVRTWGFSVHRLKSPATFSELIQERGNFPTPKFLWCAGFLKGLPILDWLDQEDPEASAVVLLAKRRVASPLNHDLSEWIEESEHYGGRRVWHPLFSLSQVERDALLASIGYAPLNHRSLECEPCVYSTHADLCRLSEATLDRTAAAEQAVAEPMFAEKAYGQSVGIRSVVKWVQMQPEIEKREVDLGCAAPFGCGL